MELTYDEIKEKVLEEVPKECPICGGSLTLSDDLMHLTCDNPDCDGKISRKLEIAAKALGIDNVGPSVAKDLVDNLGIRHISELFPLTADAFKRIPRFQDGSAQRLYQSIHSVSSVSFAQFIRSCQFARVGEGTANDIACVYGSLDEFLGASGDDLANRLGGMSKAVSDQIWASVERSKDKVKALSECVTITYPEKSKGNASGKNLVCVVTGPLGFGARPEFQETFGQSYGIKWASAVSKNTDILVTNETTPTGKYRKAQEIQAAGGKIKIMNEEEFLEYIGAENTNTADARVEATKAAVSSLQSFDGSVVDL